MRRVVALDRGRDRFSDGMKVIIVGAGGHAQVVADILSCAAEVNDAFDLVGFLDDDPALIGTKLQGRAILGATDALVDVRHDAVVVAIGDNRTRADVWARLSSLGETFVTATHPAAIVARGVEIGPGSMICAGAIVNPEATIGSNVILNTGATVDHHNVISDHAHIAPGVNLGGDVRIGEGTLVGIGATVSPGSRVGAWATVGAGAVVISDVPDGATVVGVPARRIR